MTVDERARHQLFVKLEQVLGPEEASTLMETLPPMAHGELVTKDYLDLRLNALKHELIAAMRHETRQLAFALVAVVLSISGVAIFT
jgi:hypothetical protein